MRRNQDPSSSRKLHCAPIRTRQADARCTARPKQEASCDARLSGPAKQTQAALRATIRIRQPEAGCCTAHSNLDPPSATPSKQPSAAHRGEHGETAGDGPQRRSKQTHLQRPQTSPDAAHAALHAFLRLPRETQHFTPRHSQNAAFPLSLTVPYPLLPVAPHLTYPQQMLIPYSYLPLTVQLLLPYSTFRNPEVYVPNFLDCSSKIGVE